MTAETTRSLRRVPLLLVVAATVGAAMLALVLTGGTTPARAANATVNVGEGGLKYAPTNVTVAPGDTVTWTWVGGFHNVVSTSGGFNSGAAHGTPGDPYAFTFTAPGKFYYYCSVHATAADATDDGIAAGKMAGVVTVQQQGTGTPTPTATATATPTGTATATTTATATATSTTGTTATATATPTRTATPAATVASTPSAPKTGSAGLLSADAGAGFALLWSTVVISMIAGARVLSRRGR